MRVREHFIAYTLVNDGEGERVMRGKEIRENKFSVEYTFNNFF
jgi:hypothetical protein